MILLDTSGLLSWIDQSQKKHSETIAAMARIEPPYILSPLVLAELDYLLTTRVSTRAAHLLLEQVAAGVYELPPWTPSDVAEGLDVLRRYDDLGCGITDASIVVLAARYRTNLVLTLDTTHFRVLRPRDHVAFRLVPFDM